MRRFGVLNVMILALAAALGLLIATADRRERESVDLLRPTTILSFVGKRLHALQSYIGVRIDDGTSAFRATVQKHEAPKKALDR